MRPKKTILYVEDNEQLLSVKKVILETRGYRVLSASTAAEALEMFGRSNVDLVVSDLLMPDCDGRQLLRQIKNVSPATPCILFSGKVAVFTHEDMPADVFLPKGIFAPTELLERIRLLLVRKRGPKRTIQPPPTITTGPLAPKAPAIPTAQMMS
jgi:two-component system response regulator CpxR